MVTDVVDSGFSIRSEVPETTFTLKGPLYFLKDGSVLPEIQICWLETVGSQTVGTQSNECMSGSRDPNLVAGACIVSEIPIHPCVSPGIPLNPIV